MITDAMKRVAKRLATDTDAEIMYSTMYPLGDCAIVGNTHSGSQFRVDDKGLVYEYLGVDRDLKDITLKRAREILRRGTKLRAIAAAADPPEHIETHPDGAYGMEGGW